MLAITSRRQASSAGILLLVSVRGGDLREERT